MKKFFIYLMEEGSVLEIRAANEYETRKKVEEGLKGWELSSKTGNRKFHVTCLIKEIEEIESGLFQVTMTPPCLCLDVNEMLDKEQVIVMIAALCELSEETQKEMWAKEVS